MTESASPIDAVVKYLQERIDKDKEYKSLSEHLNIKSGQISVSGRDDSYPSVPDYVGGELSVLRSSPLPHELIDRFSQMKKNCLMGLFLEGQRVWLTIDNDIFVWNYEDGSDLAYYDGLKDTIISVGFVKPKQNVFPPSIHYLLVMATHSDVVILGVNLRSVPHPGSPILQSQTMHLQPEVLMCVPTVNQTVNCIKGTDDGRIFLGTCDASLLEIQYGLKSSWLNLAFSGSKWSMSFDLVNHSTSTFAALFPKLLTTGLKDEESVVEMVPDPQRHLLYTLTNKSTISVYHLGATTSSSPSAPISREATLTERNLVSRVSRVLKSHDASQLGKVVHMVILPLSGLVDSLHLMTVNQAGIRYYFGQRLDLMHIRLPPVSSDLPKTDQVRLAAESRGTILLLSSCGEDSDVLYCLSPDPFPWLPNRTESCRISWPPSRAWIMQPIANTEDDIMSRLEKKRIFGSRSQFSGGINKGSPPVVITQHIDSVRRFLLVSAQGVVHLELPSPLQMLSQLLESSESPESVAVQKWFFHYGAEEAVYAALVLASDSQNDHLARLAKQAIFFYSTVASETQAMYQSQNPALSQQHRDNVVSSAAWVHRGLALYAARILRPIWDVSMVTEQIVKEKEIFFVSRFDTEELSWFLYHLNHLQSFIRDHLPLLRSSTRSQTSTGMTGSSIHSVKPDITDDLMDFLGIMIEIVALWKLMAEHPFYLIARRLSQDQQKHLIETPLKRLINAQGRQLLGALIAALLDHYLADGATIDAISDKLHSVCPSLYGNEDALCAKANELLEMVSRASPDNPMSDEEKRSILSEAVQIYQSVGPQIDLSVVLPRLKAAGCYWGMIKLCLSVAMQRDPENRSLICLKEGIAPHSELEKSAFEGRHDAYRRLLETLDTLLDMCKSKQRYVLPTHSSKSQLPRFPGDQRSDTASNLSTVTNSKVDVSFSSLNAGDANYITDPGNAPRSQLHMQLEEIFLHSNDILVHFEVLGWLLTNSLKKEILTSNSPHVESYLRNRLRQSPEDVDLRELLWRHCEREEKHLEAAKVLEHLAVVYCESVKLDQRIDYLTRAVVCVKATPGFQNEGDYLRDLEDKLEIAYLQRQVIDELTACYKVTSQDVVSALDQLEHQLFNVTALYTEYAERFRLLVSKLSLLRASGLQDAGIVAALWEAILDREMRMAQSDGNRETMEEILRDSICRLMEKFHSTPTYFPLETIVIRIERHSFDNNFSKEWGISCFKAMKIEIPTLIYAYDKVIKCKDLICQDKLFKRHLYDIIYSLCRKFMEIAKTTHPRYRQIHCNQISDLLNNYMLEFQSSGDKSFNDISYRMKHLKDEMERLVS